MSGQWRSWLLVIMAVVVLTMAIMLPIAIARYGIAHANVIPCANCPAPVAACTTVPWIRKGVNYGKICSDQGADYTVFDCDEHLTPMCVPHGIKRSDQHPSVPTAVRTP